MKKVLNFHSRQRKTKEIIKNMKVAVYGTLLKGEKRQSALDSSKLLGKFQTEPIFDMFSNGMYPFIIKGGNTSVTMEVYELKDRLVLSALDRIEGVDSGLYQRETIITPYGEAFYYVQLENKSSSAKPIISGDWVEFNSQENEK